MRIIRGSLLALSQYRKRKGTIRALGKLFLLTWQFITWEKTTKQEWQRRMLACYRCPMFLRNRNAISGKWNGEPKCYGCGCYMPAKAMLQDMECWANEQWIIDLEGWDK